MIIIKISFHTFFGGKGFDFFYIKKYRMLKDRNSRNLLSFLLGGGTIPHEWNIQ